MRIRRSFLYIFCFFLKFREKLLKTRNVRSMCEWGLILKLVNLGNYKSIMQNEYFNAINKFYSSRCSNIEPNSLKWLSNLKQFKTILLLRVVYGYAVSLFFQVENVQFNGGLIKLVFFFFLSYRFHVSYGIKQYDLLIVLFTQHSSVENLRALKNGNIWKCKHIVTVWRTAMIFIHFDDLVRFKC